MIDTAMTMDTPSRGCLEPESVASSNQLIRLSNLNRQGTITTARGGA